MKIFLDTAETTLIREKFATGLVDGLTTNPTLIMKSGRKPEEVYQEIVEIGVPDISMEVVGTGEDMVNEGCRLHEKFGPACTIKVPCTRGGLAACKVLTEKGIRVNVTLIFSASQAILAAKAGARYVSPFVGRVDDNSFGGLCLVREICNIYKVQGWHGTEVLAASLRNVRDVGRAFEYGADIVTMPVGVFDKMYNHVLTEKGLDLFEEDWKTANSL